MKACLNSLMGQAQQELNSLGDEALFGDRNQQGGVVLRLTTQFAGTSFLRSTVPASISP